MKVKEKWLSVLAVFISIGTAIFSIYQFNTSREDSKISAAMEFSKLYLQDGDLQKRYSIFVSAYNAHKAKPDDITDMLEERSFVDLLNYIAWLANSGQINNDYVAARIKCDIHFVEKVTTEQRPDLSRAVSDIKVYVNAGQDTGCPNVKAKEAAHGSP